MTNEQHGTRITAAVEKNTDTGEFRAVIRVCDTVVLGVPGETELGVSHMLMVLLEDFHAAARALHQEVAKAEAS